MVKKEKFKNRDKKFKKKTQNVDKTNHSVPDESEVVEETEDREEDDLPDLRDLMSEDDKLLLKDVEDNEEEETALDMTADGKDIPLSEISGFLKQLNFDKYRPSVSTENETKQLGSQGEAQVQAKTSGNLSVKNKGAKEDIKRIKTATNFLSNFKHRKHLLFKPEDIWREEKLHPLPPNPPDAKLLAEAEQLAQKLMQDELVLYSRTRENSKRSEARWMKTVLASGTLSDKMAALTLLVQESPLHNLTSLESLVSMAAKKGKREAMMAVDTLRDLFLTGLLPDDRKLRSFNQQPFLDLETLSDGSVDQRDKLLLMWHFESCVKKKYSEFIKSLGDLSFDSLLASKEKALSTVHYLLSGKPEQEAVLLAMLVNKLGDPMVKSKATYLLTKLVDEHPNMKTVVVTEVQQLLYRPNISVRAQYYAICFLVQLRLSTADGGLASQLIQIYFYFFQTYLKKGEVANKMMSALLTGVNRAYVFASAKKEELVGQMDEVYKIIPSVNFHTAVQALTLLFQVIDASSNAADRYYGCLYRKLADPALKNSSKQSIFMNLIFKSLKRDAVDRRIKAFLKRILQVYSEHPPQVICGILIILSQILGEKPGLLEVKHTAESVWSDDDEEERFVDQPLTEDFDAPAPSKDAWNQSDKDGNHVESEEKTETPTAEQAQVNGTKGSWVHRFNFGGQGRSSNYDPYGRNPLYARAELDCVWELRQLANHYHPSVRLYAETLLKGQLIKYDGDPLKDFTLIRFLDRFVYKNPKKGLDNQSSMNKFKGPAPKGIKAIPVNSREFLEAGEQGVPVDEKFFLQYFTERAKRRGEDASDADSDADSIKDAEFDAYLDGLEKDDDFGDLDLDFAGDKKKNRTNTRDRSDDEDESEEDDDEDDDLDMEDDDLAAEFRKEMEGLGDDSEDDLYLGEAAGVSEDGHLREEDIEFSPDESDELAMMMMGATKGRKRSKPSSATDDLTDSFGGDGQRRKKKRDKHDMSNLFASAEEFSHMLEEGTEAGSVSLGGAADFRNSDKAAAKQLKWEGDRDRWMKGGKRGGPRHKGKGHGAGGRQSRPNSSRAGKTFGQKPRPGQGKKRRKQA